MKLCIAVYIFNCTVALGMLEEYSPYSPQLTSERKLSLQDTPRITYFDLLEHIESEDKTSSSLPKILSGKTLNLEMSASSSSLEEIDISSRKTPTCFFCQNPMQTTKDNIITIECGCRVHAACIEQNLNNIFYNYGEVCPIHAKTITPETINSARNSVKSEERRKEFWGKIEKVKQNSRECGCMPKKVKHTVRDSCVLFKFCCSNRK